MVDSKSCAAQPQRPTITVPPRPTSFESLFGGGSIPGFSPGPMTLLSSMFSPDSNSCSFSQLLAGAMASPVAKTSFLLPDNNSTENRAKEITPADTSDKGSGYKQHRQMGLMVAHSPLFLVPSGLSPSGLLNSPGFLSPLQVIWFPLLALFGLLSSEPFSLRVFFFFFPSLFSFCGEWGLRESTSSKLYLLCWGLGGCSLFSYVEFPFFNFWLEMFGNLRFLD